MEFPNINTALSSFNYETFSKRSEELDKLIEETNKEREKRYNDGVEREKRIIELLESIDKNTLVLSDMLKLIEENTQDQKAILEIINEFNTLATINDPTKAQSAYRKTMNKINTVLSDINTMTTLYTYGTFIYGILHNLGKI